jgi:hypothetical protein
MPWADWKLRLRSIFRPRRMEADLDDELRFHLAMQARKHEESGLQESDANHRAAR